MSLSDAYAALLESGDLKPNPTQDKAVETLQSLFEALMAPEPEVRIWSFFSSAPKQRYRGVYLHGPVGRGKTTVMDLFYDVLPFAEKRRTHFHEFMLEVHDRIHKLQQDGGHDHPIQTIGKEVAQANRVLCFDEFVVNNIADAMILGRLYEVLVAEGVAMVMTSNFVPSALYENGLQRDRFLPFIDLLENTTDEIYVDHLEDYRRLKGKGEATEKTFFAASKELNDKGLQAHFDAISGGEEAQTVTLQINSRRLKIEKAVDEKVAWLDFESFLAQPLGPADFLAIARRFPAVIIANVPTLTPDLRNQARRFMTLIDALYNLNRRVIISAAALPDALYPAGDGAFEFKRTASRLIEMQSASYRNAC